VIKQYAQATGAFKDTPYWRLTLDYGKEIDRTVLEWCDEALRQIEGKGRKESRQKKSVPPPPNMGKKKLK
jgi:hypothetical protein